MQNIEDFERKCSLQAKQWQFRDFLKITDIAGRQSRVCKECGCGDDAVCNLGSGVFSDSCGETGNFKVELNNSKLRQKINKKLLFGRSKGKETEKLYCNRKREALLSRLRRRNSMIFSSPLL